MTKNVTVTWELPDKRSGGGNLDPSEIARVFVELSADAGANFVTLATLLPTEPQTVFVPDAEPGEWHFRFSVFDTLDQDSGTQAEVVTVTDDSPPLNVQNIVVTLT